MTTLADVQRTLAGLEIPARPRTPLPPMARLLRTEADPALTVIRLMLAVVMFPHGAQHLFGWFGGYGFTATHGWMTGALGIPAALAALAIVTEFFAPLALLLGLGGRLAGIGMAVLMAVAGATHLEQGFFMNWFGTLPAGAEGYQFHLLAVAMGLALAIRGSGAWSVDRLLVRRLAT